MGQYFKVVNLDKKREISPQDLNQPVKLTEHSYKGNDLMTHVSALLATHWKGDRVVWAGDYADPEDEPFHDWVDDKNLYFTELDQEKTLPVSQGEFAFFVNPDKHEYFTLMNLPVSHFGLEVHPLSILVATSNGQGGGDYFGANKELAGRWAGDRIEVYTNRTEFLIKKAVSDAAWQANWTELKPDFVIK